MDPKSVGVKKSSTNPIVADFVSKHWNKKKRDNSPRSKWTSRSSPKQRGDKYRSRPRVVSPERQSSSFIAHRFVAIDCEMVGVGPGGLRSVLARVSIADFYGNPLFDSFVRVEERVTDFRTHVSGIHEKDLKSSKAMSFGKCRSLVQEIIRNKILVGHGLHNDFSVLGIEHPWYNIRDTSMYQPYMRYDHVGNLCPCRLRDLARVHLGILIQQEGQSHDSMEDACAAMALYRSVQADWDYEIDCRRRNLVLNTPIRNYLPAY